MLENIKLKEDVKILVLKINKKLLNINLNNLDKQIILDFIYLYNLINSKEFFQNIIENLDNLTDNQVNIELKLKLENLINKLSEKKYISKIENNYIKLYKYVNRYDVYFLKPINIEKLIYFFINDLNLKNINFDNYYIEIYIKQKSKFILTNISNKNKEDFEKENKNWEISFKNFFESIKLEHYDYSLIKLSLYINNEITPSLLDL